MEPVRPGRNWTETWSQALLHHGDLISNVVSFCRLLRSHGLSIGPREEVDALRALELIDVGDREEFRLALRTVLAMSPEAQRVFDEIFERFWGRRFEEEEKTEHAEKEPQEEREEPVDLDGQGELDRMLLDWLETGEETEGKEAMYSYSPLEVLSRKDFSSFTPDEVEEITKLILLLARQLATRMSRRMQRAHRSHLMDLRRTMRLSLRRGGEILDLSFKRRRIRKTSIVLLCDVSGSMDLYSRFLIQFVYALQNALGKVETFVFSTSLHRVTEALKGRDLQEALAEVSLLVPDWSGGTRIGACLQAFLEEYGDRLLNRHTVVVIASDGWDTGDPDLLQEAMAALKRRAGKIIWLNPLLGSPGYEPICLGMSVALPYVDIFAPAHNLESLKQLARHLGVS
ncbi:MAG: VWA domain-containing protein [Armatimonadota bacterium]|nr:VWA domain-containing protein [Armatimonadota bacterium]MDR5703080.1 VWA domain-containing protein [Armatimonadota bacterium]MDR7434235.1 VWA domain-containing protein [Armatimonadota bacterium]